MAEAVSITGANIVLRAPAGEEDRVRDLECFANRGGLISRWRLSPAELEEIQRTGCVYLEVMGHGMPPVFIGSESEMRAFSLDYGGTLPKQEG